MLLPFIISGATKRFACQEQGSRRAVLSLAGIDKQRSIPMRTLIASSGIVAALLAASMAMAQTPSQNAQFCLKSSASAQPNCIYQTMAQCEQAKGTNASAQCVTNPSTTGQGGAGGNMPKSQSPSPK